MASAKVQPGSGLRVNSSQPLPPTVAVEHQATRKLIDMKIDLLFLNSPEPVATSMFNATIEASPPASTILNCC